MKFLFTFPLTVPNHRAMGLTDAHEGVVVLNFHRNASYARKRLRARFHSRSSGMGSRMSSGPGLTKSSLIGRMRLPVRALQRLHQNFSRAFQRLSSHILHWKRHQMP